MENRKPLQRGFITLGDHVVDLDGPNAEAKIQKAYDAMYAGVTTYGEPVLAKWNGTCPVCLRYIAKNRSKIIRLSRDVPIRASASDYSRERHGFYMGQKLLRVGDSRSYVHAKCAGKIQRGYESSMPTPAPWEDDTEINSTDVHEAGHAVVAVLGGVGFEYVTSIADIRGKAAGHVKPDNKKIETAKLQAYLCLLLAGREAQILGLRMQDSPIDNESINVSSSSDIEQAKDYAARLRDENGLPVPDLYAATLKLTRDTLRWHYESVICVAALLSVNRALTENDVRQAISQHTMKDDARHEQECVCCDVEVVNGFRKPRDWHRPKIDDMADQFLADWSNYNLDDLQPE